MSGLRRLAGFAGPARYGRSSPVLWQGALVALSILIALSAPAAGAGSGADGTAGRLVDRLPDGSLRLTIREPVELSALILEIGKLIGARAIVDSALGTVDPGRISPAQPREMLIAATRGHSIVLVHRNDRIVKIIAFASRDGAHEPDQPIVQEPKAKERHGDADLAEQSARAARVRDIVNLSYKTDPATVLELESLYLSSDDDAVRSAAIGALASIRRDGALPLILHALDDPSPSVRMKAAYGLSVASGARAEPRLRDMAETDPAPEVRSALDRLFKPDDAHGLGDVGSARSRAEQ